MAPTRKTRKVDKKIRNVNEDRPSKERPTAATKSKIKKRKLVEPAAPRWTEEELKTFYDSYCKYGEDWKKVSRTVGSRTPHMVEALYNMNRTYLSLPDGAASATGLIARMTDHYNNADWNNNENESHQSPKKTPSKSPPKHGTVDKKIKSKDSEARILDICPYDPNIAALSERNMKYYGVGRDLFADIKTRKRTRRVRIQKQDNRKPVFPSSTKEQNNDKQSGMAATMLVDLQNDNSQQVPHLQSPDAAINSELERNMSKSVRCHNQGERTLRSNNSPNRPSSTQKKDMATIDGKTGSKSKKFNKKNVIRISVNKSNDAQDACNSMGEHNNCNGEELKYNGNAKSPHASTLSEDKIYYGGEGIENFTALCTLADVVVSQSNIDESESLPQIKDDNRKNGCNKKQSKTQASGKNNKRKVNRGDPDGGACKKTKSGKEDAILEISHPEPQKGKKHNLTLPKTKDEANSDLARLEIRKDEVHAAKEASKSVEFSPSVTIPTRVFEDGSKTLATDNSTHSSFELKTMNRSHRKSGMVKAFSKRDNRCSETTDDKRLSSHPYNYLLHLKEKLPHALSNSLFRRWCRFEWLHSAIDYPWFVQNEYEECLNKFEEHLNDLELGYLGSLSREWVLIRGCIGKPRRFSAKFLNEQRVQLTKFRQSSREQCKSSLTGQCVIACYPKSRELHNGCILTVDGDQCRVQFDHPDLGVEFVPDIDCMLLDSVECTSEALRRLNVYACRRGVQKFRAPRVSSKQSFVYQNNICSVSQARATLIEAASVSREVMHKQPCSLLEIQERDAGIRALTKLSCALNKKEALIMELRNMHNDYIRMRAKPDSSHDLKIFMDLYATVHLCLQEAHNQVVHALGTLRQYNTYNRDAPNLLSRSPATCGEPTDLVNSSEHNHRCIEVAELKENSRQKAKMMVDAAVQAICTTDEGKDPNVRIEEVLDRLNNSNSGSVSNAAVTRRIAPDSGRPSSTCQKDNLSSPVLDPSAMSAESSKILPSELITSCLSAVLMIKDFTEKQHPPEYMAHLLDSALLSMKPRFPENMDVFYDIENIINIIKSKIIKSQMLARVPSE